MPRYINDAFEAMLLTNDLGVILNRTDTFKYSLILKRYVCCTLHTICRLKFYMFQENLFSKSNSTHVTQLYDPPPSNRIMPMEYEIY